MSTKEIKLNLKVAKDAIKNKEFSTALEACKAILEKDSDHYTALVFVGVAAEGSGLLNESLSAYRKAITVDPSQALAFQGLVSYFEKHGEERLGELNETYTSLIELHKDDNKKRGDYIKKATLSFVKSDKLNELNTLILDLASEDLQQDLLYNMLDVALYNGKFRSNTHLLYPILHNSLLSGSISENIKDNKDLIVDVSTSKIFCVGSSWFKDRDKILSCFQQHFSDCGQALNLIILGLFEGVLPKLGVGFESKNVTFASLLDVNNETKDDDLIEVLDTSTYKSAPAVLKRLANAHLALRQTSEADKLIDDALRLLRVGEYCLTFFEPGKLIRDLQILKAKVILHSSDDNTDVVTTTAASLEGVSCDEAQLLRVRLLLKLGQTDTADDVISHMTSGWRKDLARGLFLLDTSSKESDAVSCVELLSSAASESNEALAPLSRAVYRLYDINPSPALRKRLHVSLLKAAQSDPFDSHVFENLGRFYREIANDKSRSVKCFKKALELNPTCSSVCKSLCDVLEEVRGNETEIIDILMKHSTTLPAGQGSWCWLRLGVKQQSSGDHENALNSFQKAARAEPDNPSLWQCLAETYSSLGSYSASLQCFSRAEELLADDSDDLMYVRCSQAKLHLTLGQLTEATDMYRRLLRGSEEHVPALYGLAEPLATSARHLSDVDCRPAVAMDLLQEAIETLCIAAKLQPNLTCIWKQLADVLLAASQLPANKRHMKLPSWMTEDEQVIDSSLLLSCSCRCYSRALQQLPESSSLWHDFGVALFYSAKVKRPLDSELLNRAEAVFRHSLSLNSSSASSWNALGNVAVLQQNWSLAQHCFISAIEADSNSGDGWANLGTLYLTRGDVDLAHKAFSAGQAAEPTHPACWTGQAIIAESIGHSEAMDLFRHASDMQNATHISLVGYASWVCRMLHETEDRHSSSYQYNIKQLNAVMAASDALYKYRQWYDDDVCALNLHALLLEQLALMTAAKQALRKALSVGVDDPTQRVKLLINLARVCSSTDYATSADHAPSADHVPSADHAYSADHTHELLDVDASELPKALQLEVYLTRALCAFKSHQTDGALQAYESCETLISDSHSSDLLAALGMTLIQNGDLQKAEQCFFKGAQQTPASFSCLQCLVAVAITQLDTGLYEAALSELSQFSDTQPVYVTIAQSIFLAAIKGDSGSAVRCLSRALHQHPDSAEMWRALAALSSDVLTSVSCHVRSQVATEDQCEDLLPALLELGLVPTSLYNHIDKSLLIQAQRNLHSNPDSLSSSLALVSALYGAAVEAIFLGNEDRGACLMQICIERATSLMSHSQLSDSQSYWLRSIKILALFATSQHSLIQEELVELTDEDAAAVMWLTTDKSQTPREIPDSTLARALYSLTRSSDQQSDNPPHVTLLINACHLLSADSSVEDLTELSSALMQCNELDDDHLSGTRSALIALAKAHTNNSKVAVKLLERVAETDPSYRFAKILLQCIK